MNAIAKILAPLALVATVVPSVLFAFKLMGEVPMKAVMLAATVAWFIFARFWMKGGSE